MCCICIVFFFKQKTAYEMRISDWSSDVCSSDLIAGNAEARPARFQTAFGIVALERVLAVRFHRPVLSRQAEVRGALEDEQMLGLFCDHRNHLDTGRDGADHADPLAAEVDPFGRPHARETGCAPCTKRVCQTVYISVEAVSLKKTQK